MIGCLPLDQKCGQLNQRSSSPFHLADKIYGNEGVLLTFGVPLLSFSMRLDERAYRLGFQVEAANMSAMSNVIANAPSGVLKHTNAHTYRQGRLKKQCGTLRELNACLISSLSFSSWHFSFLYPLYPSCSPSVSRQEHSVLKLICCTPPPIRLCNLANAAFLCKCVVQLIFSSPAKACAHIKNI